MDITALRDGKLNLNVTDSMRFNEICEEVQELMINAVDKNGKKIKKDSVDLQIDIDPSLPSMQGDKQRLTQVVVNLVNNELKFTDSGFVKLSTKFDQGSLLSCCSDSGKGIKKDNFKKIFEAFGQEEEGEGGGRQRIRWGYALNI
jgi:signal transduction histidine kinase